MSYICPLHFKIDFSKSIPSKEDYSHRQLSLDRKLILDPFNQQFNEKPCLILDDVSFVPGKLYVMLVYVV